MYNLKISENKRHIINANDGKKFFYLGDTVWSTFANVSLEEWEEYLEYRKTQGYNALQIDILPQWDSSESELDIKPFKTDSEGNYDFNNMNIEYFLRAEKMVSMAVEKGFVPALVILWCNYVKDTWASKSQKNIMPLDYVKPFTEYVGKLFAKYNPIFIVSGDTDFQTEIAKKYYMISLKVIKEICPNCLTTMHLGGGLTELPLEYIDSKELDFYMYQSSHGIESQSNAYKMALDFKNKSVKRPVLNGEPCYEGHGHGGKYARFNRFEVRRALWQSLISGATAGITYGAHGIWSFHKKGKYFGSVDFSSMPFDWRTALKFEGAWDYSYAKHVFEIYDLFDIEAKDLILNESKEIRMAATDKLDKLAIYIPYSTEVKVNMDLSNYNLTLINLENRYLITPSITIKDGVTFIEMCEFNGDTLFIASK